MHMSLPGYPAAEHILGGIDGALHREIQDEIPEEVVIPGAL